MTTFLERATPMIARLGLTASLMLTGVVNASCPWIISQDQGLIIENATDATVHFLRVDADGSEHAASLSPMAPGTEGATENLCEELGPVVVRDADDEEIERWDPEKHCPTDVWVIDGEDG